MKVTDFVKATGNQFASVVDDGIAAGDVAGWIDTGSYALNALLSGSIFKGAPSNKIVGYAAPSSTGKTFFVLGTAKGFLDQNPDGIVMIFESESALTKEMLQQRGIDTKRTGIVPVVTVQDFRTQALKVVDNYEKTPEKDRVPLLFILDSMGMLSTTKELEDTAAGSDTRDMTRAQLLKATFRVLTLRLGRANIPLFLTNHVYDDVGGGPYAQPKISGGSGMQYAASSILTLSKAQHKDDESGPVQGVILSVTNAKSRLTKEKLKVKCLVRYDSGLDRYYWLTELAEEAGIFKKMANKYTLPDGKSYFGKTIRNEPEKFFTQEVLEQIDTWTQKHFVYGGDNDETGDPSSSSEE